eukprot:PhM_4_TR8802/c0_g1_i1/m.48303
MCLLRRAAMYESARTAHKAKGLIQHDERRRKAKKEIYHSIRYLRFAIQLARTGRIENYHDGVEDVWRAIDAINPGEAEPNQLTAFQPFFDMRVAAENTLIELTSDRCSTFHFVRQVPITSHFTHIEDNDSTSHDGRLHLPSNNDQDEQQEQYPLILHKLLSEMDDVVFAATFNLQIQLHTVYPDTLTFFCLWRPIRESPLLHEPKSRIAKHHGDGRIPIHARECKKEETLFNDLVCLARRVDAVSQKQQQQQHPDYDIVRELIRGGLLIERNDSGDDHHHPHINIISLGQRPVVLPLTANGQHHHKMENAREIPDGLSFSIYPYRGELFCHDDECVAASTVVSSNHTKTRPNTLRCELERVLKQKLSSCSSPHSSPVLPKNVIRFGILCLVRHRFIVRHECDDVFFLDNDSQLETHWAPPPSAPSSSRDPRVPRNPHAHKGVYYYSGDNCVFHITNEYNAAMFYTTCGSTKGSPTFYPCMNYDTTQTQLLTYLLSPGVLPSIAEELQSFPTVFAAMSKLVDRLFGDVVPQLTRVVAAYRARSARELHDSVAAAKRTHVYATIKSLATTHDDTERAVIRHLSGLTPVGLKGLMDAFSPEQ